MGSAAIVAATTPTTSYTAPDKLMLALEKPGSSTTSPALRERIKRTIEALSRAAPPGTLQPAKPKTTKHRSLPDLEGLLVSGIRNAQRLDWGAAISELQEVAVALDRNDAPPVGRERLLEARIQLGRAWLDAHHANRRQGAKARSAVPWRSARIARERAEEQFRAALLAMPALDISPDLYPPNVVEAFASVRRSMLAAGQPAELRVELPTERAELVVDGYLHTRGRPAQVWPGRHEIRIVDRSTAGNPDKADALPEAALGPTWHLDVPPEGLTLRLPFAHSRAVIVEPGENGLASIRRIARALGAAQAIVLAAADTAARPRLVTLDAASATLSGEVFAEIWPETNAESAATEDTQDTEVIEAVPDAAPETRPQPVATTEKPEPERRWAWLSAGAAVASLAAGGILGSLALADQAQLASLERHDPEVDDLKSRVDGEAVAADVFLALGAAAAVTAIVLFIIEGQPTEEAAVTVAPSRAKGGGGLMVRTRW